MKLDLDSPMTPTDKRHRRSIAGVAGEGSSSLVAGGIRRKRGRFPDLVDD